jgi:hypothetical protein
MQKEKALESLLEMTEGLEINGDYRSQLTNVTN